MPTVAKTEEVRFKIEQALRLMPRVTVCGLQSFLTSRVNQTLREAILKQLEAEGKITIKEESVVSYKGYTSRVRIIEKIKEKDDKLIAATSKATASSAYAE